MNDFKLIFAELSDHAWLETICDLADIGMEYDFMRVQLKCRPHLEFEKRMLLVHQLRELN